MKWDEIKNMGGGVVKATAQHNGVYYAVGIHVGNNSWYCDATIVGLGKIKFFEYADSLEEAKEIAECDADNFMESLSKL